LEAGSGMGEAKERQRLFAHDRPSKAGKDEKAFGQRP